MRKIYITCDASDSFFVMLDGNPAGKLTENELILEIDEKAHKICTYCQGVHGEIYNIPAGDKSFVFDAKPNATNATYDLIPNAAEENDDGRYYQPRREVASEKSIASSVVSAVIIGLIVCGLCFLVFALEATSLIGMLIGIVCAIGGSVCMILGGHWILIIPLPYVFIWKVGCVRKNQTTAHKVLTAVLAIVLPVIGFLLMFLLSGI